MIIRLAKIHSNFLPEENIIPTNLSIISPPRMKRKEPFWTRATQRSYRSFARSHSSSRPSQIPSSVPSPLLTPSFSVEKSKRIGASTLRRVSGDKSRRDTRKSCREVRRCSKDNAQSRRCGWISTSKPHARAAAAVWRGWLDGWPVKGWGRIHTSTRPAGAHKPVFSSYTQTRCTKPGLKHRHE